MKITRTNIKNGAKIIVKFKDLPELRKIYKNKRIVFCSGSFDLTHAGHVLFLEDCKKFGEILVVAVAPDETMKIYKEGRPILNEHIRLKMISALKPVDHCFMQPHIPFTTIDGLNDVLHILFEQLKPDVYVINSDAAGISHRREILKRYPHIKFCILKRTAPKSFGAISTTGIIEKIRGAVLKKPMPMHKFRNI